LKEIILNMNYALERPEKAIYRPCRDID
jgi:hypothetical protein